jgi:hypothetical protein
MVTDCAVLAMTVPDEFYPSVLASSDAFPPAVFASPKDFPFRALCLPDPFPLPCLSDEPCLFSGHSNLSIFSA